MWNYLEYWRGEESIVLKLLRGTSCIFLITLVLLLLLFQGKGLSQDFIPQVSLRVSWTHLNSNCSLFLPALVQYWKCFNITVLLTYLNFLQLPLMQKLAIDLCDAVNDKFTYPAVRDYEVQYKCDVMWHLVSWATFLLWATIILKTL